ncbi:DENN (AEX3) domain containing protein [Acanthamoeba castellanii str. Neff]|uniref:DENN (AEX3) domain containing protein n=1 Tax=Acanthamoeba castellanii (strain ATCC 30010 / Neff) TaxID=1257118 RepID=L8HID3_ACACF|nr:DENN (AEX3) domain containing protein [Acanthamoeba castellanii str. Neff]ELR24458.1 DENN (AEX3) domain containing protein [Acanthamoeba castellanii str. Neff]
MNKTRELAIFEYVLIVQVNPSTGQPFIAYRYPPSTDQGAKDSISGPIMRFCFPELELSDQSKKKDKKKKLLGGMGVQQSETFSTSFTLFRRILDIVEERRKASTKPKPTAVFSFLQSVLANKFPDPGETITVRTFAAGGGASSSNGDVYQLTRSLGSRFEYLDYVSFVTLFKLMPVPKILELFGNMLLERRVIVAAKTLGILSSCVNALSALLYPFSWQHVFIPVLPQSLLDYCAAPMPFMLGILADSIPAVKKQPLEEVYLVDLDKGTFIISPGFPSVLPAHELRTLEMSLDSIVASGKKGRAFDLDVAAAFLDFFQSILSGYAQFMRNNKLNVQAFRDAQPPAIKSFLDQFEASQMWFSFIMERLLTGAGMNHRETMSEKGTLRNCVLLKAQTHTPVAHNQMEQQPAVFEVCCKCGCDVEGDTQDKDGRPICMACLEAKDRKGLGMGGWFKNLRAESGYFGAGEAADESKALKSKVGNVSKRFGKSKEKPAAAAATLARNHAEQWRVGAALAHTRLARVRVGALDPCLGRLHHNDVSFVEHHLPE